MRGPTTFEEMDIPPPPPPPVPHASRFSFLRGRKKSESKDKGNTAARVDDDDDDDAYGPPDPARMPAGARRFHAAHAGVVHVVALADGCTLRVDASYLPLRPDALDAGGRGRCRCADDARAVVAAHLLHWPAFAAAHLPPGAWALPAAQAFAARLLDAWGLAARRLPPRGGPGLQPATLAAAAAALAGGVPGIAARRRRWEARWREDAEEMERPRRAEKSEGGPRSAPAARSGRRGRKS